MRRSGDPRIAIFLFLSLYLSLISASSVVYYVSSGSGASDAASGTLVGEPLATLAEACRRIAAESSVASGSTYTVRVLSASLPHSVCNLTALPAGLASLAIVGAPTALSGGHGANQVFVHAAAGSNASLAVRDFTWIWQGDDEPDDANSRFLYVAKAYTGPLVLERARTTAALLQMGTDTGILADMTRGSLNATDCECGGTVGDAQTIYAQPELVLFQERVANITRVTCTNILLSATRRAATVVDSRATSLLRLRAPGSVARNCRVFSFATTGNLANAGHVEFRQLTVDAGGSGIFNALINGLVYLYDIDFGTATFDQASMLPTVDNVRLVSYVASGVRYYPVRPAAAVNDTWLVYPTVSSALAPGDGYAVLLDRTASYETPAFSTTGRGIVALGSAAATSRAEVRFTAAPASLNASLAAFTGAAVRLEGINMTFAAIGSTPVAHVVDIRHTSSAPYLDVHITLDAASDVTGAVVYLGNVTGASIARVALGGSRTVTATAGLQVESSSTVVPVDIAELALDAAGNLALLLDAPYIRMDRVFGGRFSALYAGNGPTRAVTLIQPASGESFVAPLLYGPGTLAYGATVVLRIERASAAPDNLHSSEYVKLARGILADVPELVLRRVTYTIGGGATTVVMYGPWASDGDATTYASAADPDAAGMAVTALSANAATVFSDHFFVDSTTGSDSNSGRYPGAAFATFAPFVALLTNTSSSSFASTTLHVMSATLPYVPINITAVPAGLESLSLVSAASGGQTRVENGTGDAHLIDVHAPLDVSVADMNYYWKHIANDPASAGTALVYVRHTGAGAVSIERCVTSASLINMAPDTSSTTYRGLVSIVDSVAAADALHPLDPVPPLGRGVIIRKAHTYMLRNVSASLLTIEMSTAAATPTLATDRLIEGCDIRALVDIVAPAPQLLGNTFAGVFAVHTGSARIWNNSFAALVRFDASAVAAGPLNVSGNVWSASDAAFPFSVFNGTSANVTLLDYYHAGRRYVPVYQPAQAFAPASSFAAALAEINANGGNMFLHADLGLGVFMVNETVVLSHANTGIEGSLAAPPVIRLGPGAETASFVSAAHQTGIRVANVLFERTPPLRDPPVSESSVVFTAPAEWRMTTHAREYHSEFVNVSYATVARGGLYDLDAGNVTFAAPPAGSYINEPTSISYTYGGCTINGVTATGEGDFWMIYVEIWIDTNEPIGVADAPDLVFAKGAGYPSARPRLGFTGHIDDVNTALATITVESTATHELVLHGFAHLYSSAHFYSGTGHYYVNMETTRTWSDALAHALLVGDINGFNPYLTTVSTPGEAAYVHTKISGTYAWVGIHDPGQNGTWVYAAGPEIGQVASDLPWDTGQPSITGYCVAMSVSTGLLATRSCASLYPSVAEHGGLATDTFNLRSYPFFVLPVAQIATDTEVSAGGQTSLKGAVQIAHAPTSTQLIRVWMSAPYVTGANLGWRVAPNTTLVRDPAAVAPALGSWHESLLFVGTPAAVNRELDKVVVRVPAGGSLGTTYNVQMAALSAAHSTYYDTHFYDYHTSPTGNFATASADAVASTFFGLPGYLAHVESDAERLATLAHMGSAVYWLDGTDGGVPSSWSYTTGPNSGTEFWNTGCATGMVGTCVATGRYVAWSSVPSGPQPDSVSGTSCLEASGTDNGLWYDGSCTATTRGWVTEYGGYKENSTLTLVNVPVTVVTPITSLSGGQAITARAGDQFVIAEPTFDAPVGMEIMGAVHSSSAAITCGFVNTDTLEGLTFYFGGLDTFAQYHYFFGIAADVARAFDNVVCTSDAAGSLSAQVLLRAGMGTGPKLFPQTDGLYEVVTGSFTQANASTAAAARSYEGLSGRLVTINSEGKKNFVLDVLGLGTTAWIGGEIPESSPGTYWWTPGTDVLVWNSSCATSLRGTCAATGAYNNWADGFPTGSGAGMVMRADGQWEDADPTTTYGAMVVEYLGSTSMSYTIYSVTIEGDIPGIVNATNATIANTYGSTSIINGTSVANVSSDVVSVTVTIVVPHGAVALSPVSGGGITFATGGASPAFHKEFEFSGTRSKLNQSLATLYYRADAGFDGYDSITISVRPTHTGVVSASTVYNVLVSPRFITTTPPCHYLDLYNVSQGHVALAASYMGDAIELEADCAAVFLNQSRSINLDSLNVSIGTVEGAAPQALYAQDTAVELHAFNTTLPLVFVDPVSITTHGAAWTTRTFTGAVIPGVRVEFSNSVDGDQFVVTARNTSIVPAATMLNATRRELLESVVFFEFEASRPYQDAEMRRLAYALLGFTSQAQYETVFAFTYTNMAGAIVTVYGVFESSSAALAEFEAVHAGRNASAVTITAAPAEVVFFTAHLYVSGLVGNDTANTGLASDSPLHSIEGAFARISAEPATSFAELTIHLMDADVVSYAPSGATLAEVPAGLEVVRIERMDGQRTVFGPYTGAVTALDVVSGLAISNFEVQWTASGVPAADQLALFARVASVGTGSVTLSHAVSPIDILHMTDTVDGVVDAGRVTVTNVSLTGEASMVIRAPRSVVITDSSMYDLELASQSVPLHEITRCTIRHDLEAAVAGLTVTDSTLGRYVTLEGYAASNAMSITASDLSTVTRIDTIAVFSGYVDLSMNTWTATDTTWLDLSRVTYPSAVRVAGYVNPVAAENVYVINNSPSDAWVLCTTLARCMTYAAIHGAGVFQINGSTALPYDVNATLAFSGSTTIRATGNSNGVPVIRVVNGSLDRILSFTGNAAATITLQNLALHDTEYHAACEYVHATGVGTLHLENVTLVGASTSQTCSGGGRPRHGIHTLNVTTLIASGLNVTGGMSGYLLHLTNPVRVELGTVLLRDAGMGALFAQLPGSGAAHKLYLNGTTRALAPYSTNVNNRLLTLHVADRSTRPCVDAGAWMATAIELSPAIAGAVARLDALTETAYVRVYTDVEPVSNAFDVAWFEAVYYPDDTLTNITYQRTGAGAYPVDCAGEADGMHQIDGCGACLEVGDALFNRTCCNLHGVTNGIDCVCDTDSDEFGNTYYRDVAADCALWLPVGSVIHVDNSTGVDDARCGAALYPCATPAYAATSLSRATTLLLHPGTFSSMPSYATTLPVMGSMTWRGIRGSASEIVVHGIWNVTGSGATTFSDFTFANTLSVQTNLTTAAVGLWRVVVAKGLYVSSSATGSVFILNNVTASAEATVDFRGSFTNTSIADSLFLAGSSLVVRPVELRGLRINGSTFAGGVLVARTSLAGRFVDIALDRNVFSGTLTISDVLMNMTSPGILDMRLRDNQLRGTVVSDQNVAIDVERNWWDPAVTVLADSVALYGCTMCVGPECNGTTVSLDVDGVTTYCSSDGALVGCDGEYFSAARVDACDQCIDRASADWNRTCCAMRGTRVSGPACVCDVHTDAYGQQYTYDAAALCNRTMVGPSVQWWYVDVQSGVDAPTGGSHVEPLRTLGYAASAAGLNVTAAASKTIRLVLGKNTANADALTIQASGWRIMPSAPGETMAFTAALTVNGAQNTTVERIASAISLTGGAVSTLLSGLGPGATVTFAGHANSTTIVGGRGLGTVVVGAGAYVSGVEISNTTVSGAIVAGSTASASYGLSISNSSAQHVRFFAPQGSGAVRASLITNSIQISAGIPVTLIGNRFSADNCKTAISVTAATLNGMTIEENDFTGCGIGVALGTAVGTDLTVRNNNFAAVATTGITRTLSAPWVVVGANWWGQTDGLGTAHADGPLGATAVCLNASCGAELVRPDVCVQQALCKWPTIARAATEQASVALESRAVFTEVVSATQSVTLRSLEGNTTLAGLVQSNAPEVALELEGLTLTGSVVATARSRLTVTNCTVSSGTGIAARQNGTELRVVNTTVVYSGALACIQATNGSVLHAERVTCVGASAAYAVSANDTSAVVVQDSDFTHAISVHARAGVTVSGNTLRNGSTIRVDNTTQVLVQNNQVSGELVVGPAVAGASGIGSVVIIQNTLGAAAIGARNDILVRYNNFTAGAVHLQASCDAAADPAKAPSLAYNRFPADTCIANDPPFAQVSASYNFWGTEGAGPSAVCDSQHGSLVVAVPYFSDPGMTTLDGVVVVATSAADTTAAATLAISLVIALSVLGGVVFLGGCAFLLWNCVRPASPGKLGYEGLPTMTRGEIATRYYDEPDAWTS